ncbi:MAG TPA: 16S rRNA (cytosine(1402)-N(4))-methyltransferase RsmH [Patescibacteria group bacterium]|nr:16S rRNA (cytosine(1402)-N(4))-methyltransferase RsmH [Patescibacteria group bacterium]
MARFHKPVLLKKVLEYLEVKEGEKYLDATAGGGGHTQAILKLGGKILAIDCDPEAVKAARVYLASACPPGKHYFWRLVSGNFKDLKEIAKKEGFSEVAGILFDLGVSSYQLETEERGFSFRDNGPLDMRMDPRLGVTAADLINGLNKGELNEIFSKFSQEHYSRRFAEAICQSRRLRPIRTTGELVAVIEKALPGKAKRKMKIHPATRVFQALRIVVNDELNNLKEALPQAQDLLKPKGRLAIISFHSGEDRIVKQFFKDKESTSQLRIITKKPIRPTLEEIKENPRSRSAKLRVAEKNKNINEKN